MKNGMINPPVMGYTSFLVLRVLTDTLVHWESSDPVRTHDNVQYAVEGNTVPFWDLVHPGHPADKSFRNLKKRESFSIRVR